MSSTTLDLGPVRIVPKGTYSATATYELLNMVSYNGSSWLMKASSYTVGTTPVEGATWTLLAQKGETGAAGSDATVPIATTTTLGKVSINGGLSITAGGELSVSMDIQDIVDEASDLLDDVSIAAGALKVVRANNSGKIESGYLPLSDLVTSDSSASVASSKAVKTAWDEADGANTAALLAQTTANNALPKAGGTMTGGLVGTTVVANTSVSCPTLILNGWTVTVSS